MTYFILACMFILVLLCFSVFSLSAIGWLLSVIVAFLVILTLENRRQIWISVNICEGGTNNKGADQPVRIGLFGKYHI